jgi:hypothetical protein
LCENRRILNLHDINSYFGLHKKYFNDERAVMTNAVGEIVGLLPLKLRNNLYRRGSNEASWRRGIAER